jgi:hypothetical protein
MLPYLNFQRFWRYASFLCIALNHFYIQCVRGSKAYWKKIGSDLQVLCQYFGPATWFLTLSCDEIRWKDMEEVLRLLNSDLEGIQTMPMGMLAAKDPVTVAEHFVHRFRSFLKHVLLVRLCIIIFFVFTLERKRTFGKNCSLFLAH